MLPCTSLYFGSGVGSNSMKQFHPTSASLWEVLERVRKEENQAGSLPTHSILSPLALPPFLVSALQAILQLNCLNSLNIIVSCDNILSGIAHHTRPFLCKLGCHTVCMLYSEGTSLRLLLLLCKMVRNNDHLSLIGFWSILTTLKQSPLSSIKKQDWNKVCLVKQVFDWTWPVLGWSNLNNLNNINSCNSDP